MILRFQIFLKASEGQNPQGQFKPVVVENWSVRDNLAALAELSKGHLFDADKGCDQEEDAN